METHTHSCALKKKILIFFSLKNIPKWEGFKNVNYITKDTIFLKKRFSI